VVKSNYIQLTMTDHYTTLGVSESASQEEIKQAYRKLAMQFHPDRNPGNAEAEAKFKEINAAYSEVGEAEARSRYDQQRRGPQPGGPGGFGFSFGFGGGGIDDILDQFFAQHGFRPNRQPQRNRDFTFNLHLSLEEAFTGKQTPVQFSANNQNYNIHVSIPAGVEHGTRIRYQGHGDRSIPNAPPGDLYIHIHILDHQTFKRSGPHLHTDIEVDAFDAVLGCEMEMTCIDGQKISLTIPAGTQPGSTLRLKERGMPLRASGNPRGDCLVSVKIKIPTDLSDEIKRSLREISSARRT
jgi:DnaJ-class molecular chaperone